MTTDLSAAIAAAKDFDWDAATDRQRDAWVADWVLGMVGVTMVSGSVKLPNYTRDPAADYEVLKRVRETWPPDMQARFELYAPHALEYEPGVDDWSHSAFLALEEYSDA